MDHFFLLPIIFDSKHLSPCLQPLLPSTFLFWYLGVTLEVPVLSLLAPGAYYCFKGVPGSYSCPTEHPQHGKRCLSFVMCGTSSDKSLSPAIFPVSQINLALFSLLAMSSLLYLYSRFFHMSLVYCLSWINKEVFCSMEWSCPQFI